MKLFYSLVIVSFVKLGKFVKRKMYYVFKFVKTKDILRFI